MSAHRLDRWQGCRRAAVAFQHKLQVLTVHHRLGETLNAERMGPLNSGCSRPDPKSHLYALQLDTIQPSERREATLDGPREPSVEAERPRRIVADFRPPHYEGHLQFPVAECVHHHLSASKRMYIYIYIYTKMYMRK